MFGRTARLTSLLRQLPPPRCALELGCGGCPGLLTTASGVRVALDANLAALRHARRQDSAPYLVQADAMQLPFACRFDLILVRHPDIDRHGRRWRAALRRAVPWLTEPGSLVITVYSPPEMESVHRWLAKARLAPVSFDEQALAPAGLDGRDRFVLVYRKPGR